MRVLYIEDDAVLANLVQCSLRPLGSLRYGYGYGDKGIIEAAQGGHRNLPEGPAAANGSKPRERAERR